MKLRAINALALVATAAATFVAAAPAQGAPQGMPASTVTVTLLHTHPVYRSPNGQQFETVSATRPITGEQTTLPVLEQRSGSGGHWLLVRLPGRPNSHVGWIRARNTQIGILRWAIRISLGLRRAWVYQYGRVVRSWLVTVGKPSTPTPTGQFFIEENIAEPSDFPGAPYALATSARSNTFSEFDGGPGQIALHGVGGGLGGDPGTAESHGCVRFQTAAIVFLANHIYPGTPLLITN